MNPIRCLAITTGLVLAMVPLAGAVAQTAAQAAASAPAITASAPPAGKPEKRLLTPTESRNSATMAGERQIERPATPQISIPLNNAAQPTPKSVLLPPPRAKPAPSGGIDDSAARCAALADAQARQECRDKLGR